MISKSDYNALKKGDVVQIISINEAILRFGKDINKDPDIPTIILNEMYGKQYIIHSIGEHILIVQYEGELWIIPYIIIERHFVPANVILDRKQESGYYD
jgi:hypothetical protein